MASFSGFGQPGDNYVQVGYGFGSQWQYGKCGGMWRVHIGEDGRGRPGDPVYAMADGVVVAIAYDPQWGHVMLVRHVVPDGKGGTFVCLSQYWHVDPQFGEGTPVKRGQLIAHVHDLGPNSHEHCAIWIGEYTAVAIRGALPDPQVGYCNGDPPFPGQFTDLQPFIAAHPAQADPPPPAPVPNWRKDRMLGPIVVTADEATEAEPFTVSAPFKSPGRTTNFNITASVDTDVTVYAWAPDGTYFGQASGTAHANQPNVKGPVPFTGSGVDLNVPDGSPFTIGFIIRKGGPIRLVLHDE